MTFSEWRKIFFSKIDTSLSQMLKYIYHLKHLPNTSNISGKMSPVLGKFIDIRHRKMGRILNNCITMGTRKVEPATPARMVMPPTSSHSVCQVNCILIGWLAMHKNVRTRFIQF